jgi:MYXO-CTERM domain-containing protein
MDLDGDGVPRPADCDDADAAATLPRTFWFDGDGDGHGRAGDPVEACVAPPGTVAVDDDCDDADPAVSPGADEVCDGVDQDCDGVPDDGLVVPTWYADADGDGHGDPLTGEVGCSQPSGSVADGDDCDDGDASVHPGADEVCDGLDQDCDADADEGAVDATTFYGDADGDGYGDPAAPELACEAPDGAVDNGDDCDDGEPEAHPGGVEVCDGIDQDCDGTVDRDAIDAPEWYPDADGDGLGDGESPTRACDPPPGTVAEPGDCDDADPSRTTDCAPVTTPPPPDDDEEPAKEGCGCASGGPGGAMALVLLAAPLRRRRSG